MADTIIFLMEFALIPGLNEDVICSAITFTAVDDATFPPAAPPIPSQTTAHATPFGSSPGVYES